jgi:hypothetical protein
VADAELLQSRYEVLRTISEGRATVCQALDRQLEKPVALKIYPYANDDERAALLAETRAVVSITPHPALPVVRGDFETGDGRYVVVMDWIDGVDLEHVLEAEGAPGLPLSLVLGYAVEVAAALEHLHDQTPPLVHGDVKPANLVRTSDERIVLVDFDLAAARSAAPFGTPGFVAPEVAAGEKPTPAADVYGLAATVHTLLNGRLPGSERPEWPGIDPRATGAIASVLRAGLSTDPSERPASASRFVERLREASATDLPQGMVTLLSVEVDDDESSATSAGVRDMFALVVESNGGRIAVTMLDGAIAAFREPAAALAAALQLRQRLRARSTALDLQVRAAIEVGEAAVDGGAFTGRGVRRVAWLRSIAGPGTTIVSAGAADVLHELLDDTVSLVPLGDATRERDGRTFPVLALTPVGEEGRATLANTVSRRDTPTERAPERPSRGVPRRELLDDALGQPVTLTALTVAGLSLIYLLVLAPELGFATVALVGVVVSLVVAIGSFFRHYSTAYGLAAAQREVEAFSQAEEEARQRRREQMRERRAELERGFARLSASAAISTLHGLSEEFDAIDAVVERRRGSSVSTFSHVLPGLAENAYLAGLGVLTEALGKLEDSEGPRRQRLEREHESLRASLEDPENDVERERNERRLELREQMLASLDRERDEASDLLVEAERCEATLQQARIELASAASGTEQVSIDAVIASLEETIAQARRVQDEFRKSAY